MHAASAPAPATGPPEPAAVAINFSAKATPAEPACVVADAAPLSLAGKTDSAATIGATTASTTNVIGLSTEVVGKPRHSALVQACGTSGTCTLQDRCVGILIGGICGDVLGAVVEARHMSSQEVADEYGVLRDFIPGKVFRRFERTAFFFYPDGSYVVE